MKTMAKWIANTAQSPTSSQIKPNPGMSQWRSQERFKGFALDQIDSTSSKLRESRYLGTDRIAFLATIIKLLNYNWSRPGCKSMKITSILELELTSESPLCRPVKSKFVEFPQITHTILPLYTRVPNRFPMTIHQPGQTDNKVIVGSQALVNLQLLNLQHQSNN